jgi:hypothetical protein
MTPEEYAFQIFCCVEWENDGLTFKDVSAADIIRQAIADEREACAHVAFLHDAAPFVVAAIRARGKE